MHRTMIRLDARSRVCDAARRLPTTGRRRPPDRTGGIIAARGVDAHEQPGQHSRQLPGAQAAPPPRVRGELTDLDSVTFRDLSKLDVVGIFPDYASAAMAWKAKAQQTVDSAQTRYFIVHLHKLLQP